MKRLFLLCLLLIWHNTMFAGTSHDTLTVCVMDLGTHPGAVTDDIALANAEKTSSEYVIYQLLQNKHFEVVERDILQKQLTNEKLNTTGVIDPETARRIGELLRVKYLIYGNVLDVSLSDNGATIMGVAGVTVDTIKAKIVLRMMDIETGTIIMAAKGDGKSKTSYTEIGSPYAGYITIGTVQVTQDAVHNALRKSACNAVDKLVMRLYGIEASGSQPK